MGFMNDFAGPEAGWLRRTLAAGVFAAVMLPGSALATAEYFVEANATLGFEFGGDIQFLDTAEATHAPFANTTGDATANVLTDVYVLDPTVPFVQIEFAAAGTADRSFPGDSESNAGVDSLTFMSFLNTGDQPADIFPFFDYAASALIATDDPLNEIAGATATIILDVDIDNVVTELVSEVLALPGTDSQLGGGFADPITLGPGELAFVGLTVDINGLAIAFERAPAEVTLPATLALLGVGMIGFATRRRDASA